MAVLLYKNGEKEKAEEIYGKYQSSHFSQTLTGKQFGIPYLLDAGRYQEAASLNEACLSAFTNDTIKL